MVHKFMYIKYFLLIFLIINIGCSNESTYNTYYLNVVPNTPIEVVTATLYVAQEWQRSGVTINVLMDRRYSYNNLWVDDKCKNIAISNFVGCTIIKSNFTPKSADIIISKDLDSSCLISVISRQMGYLLGLTRDENSLLMKRELDCDAKITEYELNLVRNLY